MNNASVKDETRNKIYAVISHSLVVVWMIVIFCFSAQGDEDSSALSGGITKMLIGFVNRVFQMGWNEAEIQNIAEFLSFPIRKLAHMTEFGVLAVLIFMALKHYVKIKTTKQRYRIAWVATVCYAATDEFHQLFVSGRSGNIFDVCVDATGALIALILIFMVMRTVEKARITI